MQRLLILIGVGVALIVAATRLPAAAGQETGDRSQITPALRAATLWFAPEVAPEDRAWILAAIARARPEARRLIAEIDGLVEVRTDLDREHAIGVTHIEGDRVTVSVDVRALNGDRALDRDVVVLHELGHVIDYLLVPDDLVSRLDRSIPQVGTCSPAAEAPQTPAFSCTIARSSTTAPRAAAGASHTQLRTDPRTTTTAPTATVAITRNTNAAPAIAPATSQATPAASVPIRPPRSAAATVLAARRRRVSLGVGVEAALRAVMAPLKLPRAAPIRIRSA